MTGDRHLTFTWAHAAVLVLFVVVVSGCADNSRSPSASRAPAPKQSLSGLPEKTAETTSASDPSPTEETELESAADVEVKVVGADDAQAGSTIGGGILTEPLHQRFHIAHRLVFLQIENAMKTYHAFKGYYPKSHEEFMKEIIQENGLELPELRDGWTYFYDPEDHTLKQQKPK